MKRWFHVIAVLLALGFAGCTTPPSRETAPRSLTAQERTELHTAVFERVASLVERKYFDPKFGGLDWRALCEKHRSQVINAAPGDSFYRALNELLDELKTSHLVAITPRDTWESKTRLRARIGVAWHKYGERWVVEEVVPGGPADEAGLKPGWLMETVEGKTFAEAVPLRLTEGVPVTVTCTDNEGVLRTLRMNPRILSTHRPNVSNVLEGGFLYLRFDEFDRPSRRWLSDELKRHRASPGLILDLRRNHGGGVYSLDLVAAEFFDHSVSVGRMIKRSGRNVDEQSLAWSSARYKGRLVVLIDDSSYSAAEILSHALRFHKRAVLVGRKTGGAVVAALDYGLPDGGSIQIPVTDFVGLDGKRIEGSGLEPDIAVERSLEALRAGRDLDVEAALALLKAP